MIGRISSCLLLLGLVACTSLSTSTVETESNRHLELPSYDSNQTITTHKGFRLLYSEAHEQAEWVAYELTASETDGPVDRTGNYREDPSIPPDRPRSRITGTRDTIEGTLYQPGMGDGRKEQ